MELILINNGKLEKTKELYGTSFATIYASAYVAAIKDYALKHKMNLRNDELYDILHKSNPKNTYRIVLEPSIIFS